MFTEKVFRDPVHANISVTHAAVLDVIDSPEFQRLRRIHQLGMCHTVYHGAEHSRFQHSLGAMWLMHRILRQWRERQIVDIPPSLQLSATLAAMLHDVGHGPFSHALEHVFGGFHHEEIGFRIVSERLRPLLNRHGVDTDEVLDIMRGTGAHPYLSELISSQLDVDRMDYLLRDSLYTGVRYGLYDVERMIYALRPISSEGGAVLALDAKGVHVAEEYLFSRYSMYWQVYFHKTTRSCEFLLQSVLRRARDLAATRPDAVYLPPGLAFIFAPREAADWLSAFLDIDDTDLYHAIKQWRHSSDRVLSDLADRFINRRLLKAISVQGDPASWEAARAVVEQKYGDDASYYFHVDRPSDAAYDLYGPAEGVCALPPGKSCIRVVTRPPDGWEEISQVTQTRAVQALGQMVSRAYLLLPQECVAKARTVLTSAAAAANQRVGV